LTQFGWEAGQAFVQEPQLKESVLRSTSQPFASALLSQSAKPGLHRITQLPEVQLGVPLAALQTVPQAPQSIVVSVSVSQPSSGWTLQSPKPESQTGSHAPPMQLVLPCAFVQAVPQLPQSVMLTATLTHCSVQHSNPVGHVEEEEQPGMHDPAPLHSLPGGHGLCASQPVHW
jgi:hypothetical protein